MKVLSIDTAGPVIGVGYHHQSTTTVRIERIQRGAVQFSFAEEIFEFDADQQMTGVGRIYQSSAMKLIEQFMLEANETVARHCVKNKMPALYRVHERPDMRKLQKLQKIQECLKD